MSRVRRSPLSRKVEITFEGDHRVTVDCSVDAAAFLRLAAVNTLRIISADDYYEYYDLPNPGITSALSDSKPREAQEVVPVAHKGDKAVESLLAAQRAIAASLPDGRTDGVGWPD